MKTEIRCFSATAALALALAAGCASTTETVRDGWRESPTGSLFRGDLEPGGYLSALKRANEEANRREQFEVNKSPDRVYNTRTGRYEYLRADAPRVWNAEKERWEHTPADRRDRPARDTDA
ncbi:MAG: hypothetical protein JJU00_12430 [Opitutales bacterium]|nr:hypothetical protein [Opitutales bacterium]